MSSGTPLHRVHAVEQEKSRSRAQRIWHFVPLTVLMVIVLVLTIIGASTRIANHEAALQQQRAVLSQPAQQASLPQSCTSTGFPGHPADIWTGARTAESEAAFAAHPDAQGMRVQGRGGFDFWGDAQSQNMSQALGRAPWLDAQLAQWLTYFDGLDKQLRKDGRDLVIFVAPAKWELYRDQLPEWADGLQGRTHLEQFLEHSGDLPVVDVRDAMQKAKQEAPVYSAVNSHWTPYGAYAAWRQTVACAAALYPGSVWGKLAVPTVTGVTSSVAPNEFAAFGDSSSPEDWTTPTITGQQTAVRSTITGTDGAQKAGPSDGSVGLLDMPARTTNPAGVGRALILRDSTGEALAPTWAQAFQDTCQVRHNLDYPDKRPDVVAEARTCGADTVLYVFTERLFSQAPPSLPAG
ncbi:SGNH hydrolase-like domain-containing protein, acetyltransferase AlgX [Microbacterium azadirachtae]|uniref:SGNH hydrolase-like domain-containing protein, acetyltransferase AlgX n=1 Tax=Microbacterium azadirachtae TaxID=582680 RepID=A0A1I6GJD9_9MICO|nr:hypothetical protein [Microbacterium azadirachtae]SFR42269.1 SGNH hydrolase-like domain-containing protein, acetyltransferase AlgX [Microbacterium azadirachtae]